MREQFVMDAPLLCSLIDLLNVIRAETGQRMIQ